jgi:hypothetical protein
VVHAGKSKSFSGSPARIARHNALAERYSQHLFIIDHRSCATCATAQGVFATYHDAVAVSFTDKSCHCTHPYRVTIVIGACCQKSGAVVAICPHSPVQRVHTNLRAPPFLGVCLRSSTRCCRRYRSHDAMSGSVTFLRRACSAWEDMRSACTWATAALLRALARQDRLSHCRFGSITRHRYFFWVPSSPGSTHAGSVAINRCRIYSSNIVPSIPGVT